MRQSKKTPILIENKTRKMVVFYQYLPVPTSQNVESSARV